MHLRETRTEFMYLGVWGGCFWIMEPLWRLTGQPALLRPRLLDGYSILSLCSLSPCPEGTLPLLSSLRMIPAE